MININKINQNEFRVEINNLNPTDHTVFLDDDYWRDLTGQKISKEEIILKSFEFLLERESNNSILRVFNLREINNYFSHFETEIKTKF